MKFYKVSHTEGKDAKVIVANTAYEAMGFYVYEEVENINTRELDRAVILPEDYKVPYLIGGDTYYQTLMDLFKEKDNWIYPKTIAHL